MSDIARFQSNPRMSGAVVHLGIVYLSGQLALDNRGGDVATQTREVLERIDLLLAEAGSRRDHLLSATIYLTDMAHFEAMNAEWDAWLAQGAAPARATVGAALAFSGFDVEIAVIAAVG